VDKTEINCFSDELNSYLLDRYKYKRNVVYVSLSNNINANRKKFDIYLRWKPDSNYFEKNTLVIARLHFFETRKGNGTSLLQFFIKHSKKYKYENIMIECANENATAFAKRYNFSEYKNDSNFIISTGELENSLRFLI